MGGEEGSAPQRRMFGKARSSRREPSPPPPPSPDSETARLLQEAQAQRRYLLGRIATLQHRLREEVLAQGEFEERREQQREERKERRLPEDDARNGRAALTQAIAQIDRIVTSSEQPMDGSVGD
ncbi:MAG: hypothetical protein SGPRY_013623, partial [Prymnesium sp.]